MNRFARRRHLTLFLLSFLFISFGSISAQYGKVDLEKIESSIYDVGKMWTFDYPPVEYLEKNYNFKPDQEWFDDVRMSYLMFGGGCSSSFVSADGLIMTNHHCIEGAKKSIKKEGEDLELTGFYAATPEEERRVPNLSVQQLVFMRDVSDEVLNAMNAGSDEQEKIKFKEEKIKEIQSGYNEETGLNCRVVSFWNGSKYSVYGYKRYTDVRMVFIPETQIGYFGGDWDNFTYPRYNLDVSFLRVYDENGEPVKSEHYFKWNTEGPKNGEVLFTVGNPGRTNRLYTYAQLESYRDYVYRNAAFQRDELYNALGQLQIEYPEKAAVYEELRTSFGNSQKVIHNIYYGLLDPALMARKKDFEKKIIEAVNSKPELKEKYGNIWEAIETGRKEFAKHYPITAVSNFSRMFSSKYFTIGRDLNQLAKQLELKEEEREEKYKGAKFDSTIASIFPDEFDKVLEDTKLRLQIEFIALNLGAGNEIVQNLTGGKTGEEAVKYLLSKSKIKSKDEVINLAKSGAEALLNSGDPFIGFAAATSEKSKEAEKLLKEISNTEEVYLNMLGQVLFELYGTTIPPDANMTLRLSDGVLTGFEYNGTLAPVKTTFYGMYDRYYSNEGKYPWSLPERWIEAEGKFDMSKSSNFVSTNDIVGGNSGSAMINKNAEVIGLAFDGNVESIVGNFIYLPKMNRCVGVSSQGLLEAVENVYKAKALALELRNGKR